MKNLNVAVLVSSVILMASGLAMAEEVSHKNYSNQQFNGQRPYMKAPTQESTYNADDQWEGATLVTDINPDETANAKHQQMRLNSLAKRAY